MKSRPLPPFIVVFDSRKRARCVNFEHVQLISELESGGALIEFANGEQVTVSDDFDEIVRALVR